MDTQLQNLIYTLGMANRRIDDLMKEVSSIKDAINNIQLKADAELLDIPITVKDASRIAHVSESTINRALEVGNIKRVTINGKRGLLKQDVIRFYKSKIDKYEKRNKDDIEEQLFN